MLPRHSPALHQDPSRGGFSLVEVMVASVVLSIGVLGFTQAMIGVRREEQTSREARLATLHAQNVIESMAAVDPSEIYARYNSTDADDPPIGESPGAVVDLGDSGLGDSNASCRVVFPEQGGVLRESVDMPVLGMPRDLNLDGVINGSDRAADYRILPVLVRVQWTGASQNRVELKTLFITQ